MQALGVARALGRRLFVAATGATRAAPVAAQPPAASPPRNALLAATTMTGADDVRVYARPRDRLLDALRKDGRTPRTP